MCGGWGVGELIKHLSADKENDFYPCSLKLFSQLLIGELTDVRDVFEGRGSNRERDSGSGPKWL